MRNFANIYEQLGLLARTGVVDLPDLLDALLDSADGGLGHVPADPNAHHGRGWQGVLGARGQPAWPRRHLLAELPVAGRREPEVDVATCDGRRLTDARSARSDHGGGVCFWFFILGTLLTSMRSRRIRAHGGIACRGRRRSFAAVPAATLIGVLLFEEGGGLVIAVTWVVVAAMSLRRPASATKRAAPAPP